MTTMLIVHFPPLRREIARFAGRDVIVVLPLGSTMGLRLDAVVFVDSPGAEEIKSAVWSARYRDWFDSSVLTRLKCERIANVLGAPQILHDLMP